MSQFNKTILVTGGAGFIGSNFVEYFCTQYPEYLVLNLDKLSYAGSLKNLSEVEALPNYRFYQVDLAQKKALEPIFKTYAIDGIIHFAAETHIDNSIKDPSPFVESNILGTVNLLSFAKEQWLDAPHCVKERYRNARFHQISTDEVYGSLSLGDTPFSETSPFSPNNPYSASKASADCMVRAFHQTYGLNTTISHCSNNFGPKQHSEKLIPTVIAHCLNETPIPIYGTGLNIRDWLFVLDHCKAVDAIFHQGQTGESYNVGALCEKTNLDIVAAICEQLDRLQPSKNGPYRRLITLVNDRPGHDFRYALDSTKLATTLHWAPETSFEDGLMKTIEFYLANSTHLMQRF